MDVDTASAFTRGEDAEDIYVKDDWRPKRSQPMPGMDGYYIGKKFGAGALSMNSIYDLVDREGKSLGQALKVCKQSLSARRSLAHEWKMFKDLRVLGEEHAAARSHFLQAHRVMKLSNNRIVGIIMEKANGHNVSKTLNNSKFCNVRYVISLLRDLLVSLDVAQRVLGFVHYDLKLDNVMEHWSCNPDPDTSRARVLIDGVPQFKLFDFGTAVVYPDPFAVKRVPDKRLSEEHRPTAAEQLEYEKKHGETKKPGKITNSAADDALEYSEPFGCVRIYHMWWKTRGDVFRVLLALSKLLDDRTWPLEDLELVSLLFTVLEHATNSRRIRAKFLPRAALMRNLGLPDTPGQQQQQEARQSMQPGDGKEQPKPTGASKQAPVLVAAADVNHAIAPATPVAADAEAEEATTGTQGVSGGYSSVRRVAADAPRSPRVSMDAFNGNNKRFNIDGPATPGTAALNGGSSGNGVVVSMISSMVNSAAASGGADKGHNSSTEGLGLNRLDTPAPGAVEALPGVAYTRLAPVSASTAAVAPDSTSMPNVIYKLPTHHHHQQQQGLARSTPTAPAGVKGLSSVKTDVLAEATHDQARTGGAATCAVEPRFDVNAPDEGCRIDPAAQVVERMPIAPADHQSVLGSRKALKGVTAQQLLLEPIVQSLLTKV